MRFVSLFPGAPLAQQRDHGEHHAGEEQQIAQGQQGKGLVQEALGIEGGAQQVECHKTAEPGQDQQGTYFHRHLVILVSEMERMGDFHAWVKRV